MRRQAWTTHIAGEAVMWNSFRTDSHQGMIAGTTTYVAGGGDLI